MKKGYADGTPFSSAASLRVRIIQLVVLYDGGPVCVLYYVKYSFVVVVLKYFYG